MGGSADGSSEGDSDDVSSEAVGGDGGDGGEGDASGTMVGVGSTAGVGFASSVDSVGETISSDFEGISGVEDSAEAAVAVEVGGEGDEGAAGDGVVFFLAHGTV